MRAAARGGNNDTSTGSGNQHRQHIRSGRQLHILPRRLPPPATCSGNPKEACSNTTTAAAIPTTQNLSVTGSLDSYVGSGTVAVDRTAPTLSASQSNGVFTGAETTQYDLTWAGDLSATLYVPEARSAFLRQRLTDRQPDTGFWFGRAEQHRQFAGLQHLQPRRPRPHGSGPDQFYRDGRRECAGQWPDDLHQFVTRD